MTINNEHNKLNVPNLRFKEFSEEWEKKTIGEISTIKNGPFGSVLHAEDYVDEGMPIVTTEHFKNGNLPQSKNGIPQVSDDDYYRLRGYKLEKDDIVFSRVGSIDINAHVEQSQQGWLFSGRVLRVRPIKSVNSLCLHYILSTESVKRSIRNRAVGQTMPSINTPILSNTKINIPQSVVEQKKIANLLALLDKRIAIQSKVIDKLQSLIKGIRHDIFNDIQGEVLALSNIADIYQPQTISSSDLTTEGYWVYGANGIIGKYKEYNHETEQICITCRGNTCGTVNYTQPKVWITGNSMVVNTDKYQRQVNKRFLFHYLSSYNFKSIVSGSGQPQIVRTPLEKIKVVLPTIEKQVRIANSIDIVSEKINTESSVLRLLENQKQYLLRQMFI